MANWFGSLDLAYKYTIVFVSLLLLTLVAGLIKVMIDRKKLKKFTKQANEEAGIKDDQVELNQREKDEGDLFGVRAIEAGFYAGIPQSRPTSRAGSYAGSPSMSSSTLLGGYAPSKNQTNSMASSVTDLPLAHTNNANRDSSTLPSGSPPQRKTPPAIRLAPSEAEMSGRHNHNGDVNMNLAVPPSPVLARPPRSPAYDGSDDELDARPRSPAGQKPSHYAPAAPQLPMPSFYTDNSPNNSTPSSPGPKAVKPSMPSESKSPYASNNAGSQSMSPTSNEPVHPAQPTLVLPSTTYEPLHKRDQSSASSVYSEKRTSTYQSHAPAPSSSHERTTSTGSYLNDYSFPSNSSNNRNSVIPAGLHLTTTTSQDSYNNRQSSADFLAPGGSQSRESRHDPRFSEFYDAYYRESILIKDAPPKRPDGINTEATIAEVDTPLASPVPGHHPGLAM